MPFVRTRTTKAGTLSTALVEAYRDEQGRPRQRLLANLHGETDTLRALAKIWVRCEGLDEHSKELMAEYDQADEKTKGWRAKLILGNERERDRFLKDGLVLEQHCTATPEQLQAAMTAYSQALREAALRGLGMHFEFAQRIRKADAALRRLAH